MTKQTNTSENTDKKQNSGHLWRKGVSGNPSGKPKGSLNRVTLAIQSLLDGEGEELTRKAIELAKDGDLTALRAMPWKESVLQENHDRFLLIYPM